MSTTNTQSNQIVWQPQEKQALALSCPAFELFYGGAAGGGKSDFLLIDFLGGANEWKENWNGILFRKTYAELEDLMKRARQLYIPIGAIWKSSAKTFVFPNGATLKFRHLERDEDVTHYQGHQFTWVGFDELGNYASDYCWRYMISRIRSAAGADCYIRGTGNPGGVGHAWVKNRFIDFGLPYKIYRDAETENTRCFIPSTLDDNLQLAKNDPGYEKRMKLLPAQLYNAMRFGDWDTFQGQAFGEFKRQLHVIKPTPLSSGEWYKFMSLDWGFSKPYSLGWWAAHHSSGQIIRYREHYGCAKDEQNVGIRRGATDVAKEAWTVCVGEGVTDVVADPAIWNKTDDGPSVAEKFAAVGFKMHKANNDRINGKLQLHQLLMTKTDDRKPLLQVFENCFAFIRTIPVLLPDKNRPEDIDSSLEDHAYDETRYAIMSQFYTRANRMLQKQNGSYNFRKVAQNWDPYTTK